MVYYATISAGLKINPLHSGLKGYSTCSFVKTIRPEDLETSPMPAVGKTLHKGFPQ